MGFDPASLAIEASLASAAVSAGGAIMQGESAKASGKYNAQVAANNAKIATQNAVWAGQAGEEKAANKQLDTRNQAGQILASEGASGVDINSGSFQQTRQSQDEIGKLDAMTIRSNAAKEAYGYVTQATSDEAQAKLDKAEGSNAETAGFVGAGSSLLSGVGQAAEYASPFSKFQADKSLTGAGALSSDTWDSSKWTV